MIFFYSVGCVLPLATALTLSREDPIELQSTGDVYGHVPEAYIMHTLHHDKKHPMRTFTCNAAGDGLGSNLRYTMPIIEAAMRQGLTYVCLPDDFKSAHKTGYLGYLFGCNSFSEVYGQIASYDDILKKTNESYLKTIEAWHNDLQSPIRWTYDDDVHKTPEPKTLYSVYNCPKQATWGMSHMWYKSQYHLVRTRDEHRRHPDCGQDGSRKYMIVLGIRRGDAYWNHKDGRWPELQQGDPLTGKILGGARGLAAKVYAHTLDQIFAGNFSGPLGDIKERDASIVVIAETPEDDAEIREFDRFHAAHVTYLLGIMEHEGDRALKRFVADTDCMSVADVLLTSIGQYGALTAALQKKGGIALQYVAKGPEGTINAKGSVSNELESPPGVIQIPVPEF